MEYTADDVSPDLLDYIESEELLKYFKTDEQENIGNVPVYTDPNFGCRGMVAYPPDVKSADLCLMEPTLLPGCFIVVDGTNNARFIKNNFQRGWLYTWHVERDISTFELKEEPIGTLNSNMLKYCGLL